MTKVKFEEAFEIYLFTDTHNENSYSKLNEFLSFLKFNRANITHKFSYVSSNDELIPELSLNENILMNFSPDSLTAGKEFQFQEYLKVQSNRDLEKLYQKLTAPHDLPGQCDAQIKKICSLIKSLIFEGQFIFLEQPEKDLDSNSIVLLISCLKDYITRNKLNIFIFSNQLDLWMPHVHQHVKREKDYSFCVEKVSKNWAWNKEKKQFFAPIKKEDIHDNALTFKFPKNFPSKKTAA